MADPIVGHYKPSRRDPALHATFKVDSEQQSFEKLIIGDFSQSFCQKSAELAIRFSFPILILYQHLGC